MKQLFNKLSKLSYPTVFFIASFLTVVSVLPLWIYISGQQTRIATRAEETTPLVPTSIPTPTEGMVPANPPTIIRAYPWVGKAGDVIIIEGKNFGAYPKNRRLAIGGMVVADALISQWSDTQIEVLIPSNPKSGEPAALRIDTYPIVESVPLTFYDETASVRLRKQGAVVSVEGVSGEIRATLFTQNGKRETTVTGTGQETVTLFTLAPSEEILSIMLADEKGAYIPYSINPTEFGF
jgi:hypothetical protein